MKQIKAEPLALTVISGVEFVAMVTGVIPTWTSMWGRLPEPARRVLRPVSTGVVAWWWWHHFSD